MSLFQSLIPSNNNLVKRILNWKQGDEEDSWSNRALETLIKKLKKQSSEDFHNFQLALTRKCEETPCVPLAKSQDGRLQVSHRKMLPQVMYCRIFRWPDLQSQHELQSLPRCQFKPNSRDTTRICVNPYHYVRVDHSLYPPVVTPRRQMDTDTEFIDASPPPMSPLSPGSTYSQQPESPNNYFHSSLNQMPPPAHDHSQHYLSSQQHPKQECNPNYPFDYMRTQNQLNGNSQNGMGFAYGANSPSQSESNYHNGVGQNGEPIINMVESPRATQSFELQTPPPRYSSRDASQLALMPMDTTNDAQQTNANFMAPDSGQEHWCRIIYHELNQKVGEPFKSSSLRVIVDGYTNPSVHNRRFSLGVLSNVNRNSTIEMTRRAIRKGICLENFEDKIYVTNLSESSIFFHSKNCNVENQLNQHAVIKIESQGRHKIFDQAVFEGLLKNAIESNDGSSDRLYSLVEHCSIKLSFVKGWGSIYQRQDVTSTPCWIDICLLKPNALIDPYLQQTGPPSARITSTS